MDFSALEARVNAQVFRTFENARAVFGPGPNDSFGIVLDRAGGITDESGVVTQQPSFTVQPSAYAIVEGLPLTIDGVAYTVRAKVPLDEGGWQRVILARVGS